MKATVGLPRDLTAPRQARRWVHAQLGPSVPQADRLDVIELLVTELVTNVVVHTTSSPTLTVEAEEGRVLIEVADDGGGVPSIPEPDPDRVGGWGLRIVEQLADSWGTSYRPTGTKVLWFSLSTAA